jgi:hypothetical protein
MVKAPTLDLAKYPVCLQDKWEWVPLIPEFFIFELVRMWRQETDIPRLRSLCSYKPVVLLYTALSPGLA